jgi:hypothetical protein
MLGGRVLGEGVDGCILSEPMWPCSANTASHVEVNSRDPHYVSKIVNTNDEEIYNLKIVNQILGPEMSSRYIIGLHSQCKPADKLHPASPKNTKSVVNAEKALISWPNGGKACSSLKNMVTKGKNISSQSTLMIIPKYEMTFSGFIHKVNKPYELVVEQVQAAVPGLMVVLQRLYQGALGQLIHTDLHSENIVVKRVNNGIEFGLADFGRCISRLNGIDSSKTFYCNFLIKYISRIDFFYSYSQIPFEIRLLNYCYRKNMENVLPSVLLNGWVNDKDVVSDSNNSTDLIQANRHRMVSYLLKRVLFIAMIEQIQSICRKLRANPIDYKALDNSLNATEKIVLEFILTRYSILSPFNSMIQELMYKFNMPLIDKRGIGTTNLIRFMMLGILVPYDQEGSSLSKALTAVQGADMRILWFDVVKAGSP